MENLIKKIEEVFFTKKGMAYVFLACISFFTYAQTLFYDLTYSDDHVLVAYHYEFNEKLSNIDEAFSEDIFKSPAGYGSYYRPILRLSFMLDAQFGQKNVLLLSHLSNIFFHIVVSCLLMVVLIRMGVKKEWGLIFALFFSVHPLHTQTVALIASRNDSILAIFILLGFLAFLNYIQKMDRKSAFFNVLFFALALFTKETAIVLPVLCVLYILIFDAKKLVFWRSHVFLVLCWVSVVLFWIWARIEALGNLVSSANFEIINSIKHNYLVIIPQIGKMVLPFSLSPFPVMADMNYVYGSVAIVFSFIWILISKNKNWKMIIFGLVWVLVFMFFSILKPAGQIPEFSEHRLYIASIGVCFIILGMGKLKFLKNEQSKLEAIILIIVFILFIAMTMYRNQFYKDGVTFWTYASESSPSRAFNFNNLGAMYFLRGNLEQAEALYKKTLELNPREPLVNYNLGLIYEKMGEYEKAKNAYIKEKEVSDYDDVEALMRIKKIQSSKK